MIEERASLEMLHSEGIAGGTVRARIDPLRTGSHCPSLPEVKSIVLPLGDQFA